MKFWMALLAGFVLYGQEPKKVWKMGEGGVRGPQLLKKVQPLCSGEGQGRCEGQVLVELVVNAEGLPTELQVKDAPHKGLADAALEALRKWRFAPGMRHGEPVAVRVSVQVDFHRFPPPGQVEQPLESMLPRPVKEVQPRYPKGRTGDVVIGAKVTVDDKGMPEKVEILKPAEKDFAEAAREALEQWRFAPGTVNGRPVRMVLTMRVPFRTAIPEADCGKLRDQQARNDLGLPGTAGVEGPSLRKRETPATGKALAAAAMSFSFHFYVEIDEQGSVTLARPLSKNRIRLADAGREEEFNGVFEWVEGKTAEALRRWEFSPARKMGEPVASAASVAVTLEAPGRDMVTRVQARGCDFSEVFQVQ